MTSLLDRIIAMVSPSWAYRRARYRAALVVPDVPDVPGTKADDTGWRAIEDANNLVGTDYTAGSRTPKDIRRWFM